MDTRRMRTWLKATSSALALLSSVPQAALADSYVYRGKHVTIVAPLAPAPAPEVPEPEAPQAAKLALSPDVGTAATRDHGAAWNLSFSASGGEAPYTVALDTARSGALAGLTATSADGRLTVGGTAPAGTYRLDATVTDAKGAKATGSLDVTVRPETLPATDRRPTTLTGSYTPALAYPGQPAWNVLYDGSKASYIHAYNGGPVTLDFKAPVSFDSVYMDSQDSGEILAHVNGTWTLAGRHNGGAAAVKLSKAFTSTSVRFRPDTNNAYMVYEMRVGNGAIPLAPIAGGNVAVPLGSDVIGLARFETRSYFDRSELSLAGTQTRQNGVVLDVKADRVTIVSRPPWTAEVVVVAEAPDGLRSWNKFLVEGAKGGSAEVVRPTSLTSSYTPARAYQEQLDWHVLYDGSKTSYIHAYNGGPLDLLFAEPAAFDRVYLDTQDSGDVLVRENGVWIQAGRHGGGVGTVSLWRAFVGSSVRFRPDTNNAYMVYEMRVGAAPVPLPAQPKAAASRKVAVGATMIGRDLFETRSLYSADQISFALTPSAQSGVVLDVSDEKVVVRSRPDHNVEIAVAARTPDGLVSWNLFTVEADAALPVGIPRPTSLTSSYTPTKAYTEQAAWNVLYDGSKASYIHAYNGGPLDLVFAGTVAFDRVYLDTQDSGDILVREGTTWLTAGRHGGGVGTVTLRRPFAGSAVRFRPDTNNAYMVYEMRVGGIAAPAAPSLRTGTAAVVGVSQDTVDRSAFQTGSHYPVSAISLAATPAEQNGVRLDVSDGILRVLSRPAQNVDIAVSAKTPDGMQSWSLFRVEAVAGAPSEAPTPSGAKGSYAFTKSGNSQPDWNTLYDGSKSTGSNAYNGGPVEVSFGGIVAFDRVRMDTQDSGDLLVNENGTWIAAGRHGGGSALVTLRRPFAGSAVRFRPDTNNAYMVYEMRVGDAPAKALP